MKENNTCLGELAQLSTPRLDEILQDQLQMAQPDSEVVLEILRILEEREADYPVTITREASDAWERYHQKITPLKKKRVRVRWLAPLAAAAAVLCIIVFALPRFAKAEGVLNVLFCFSESIFELFTPGQDTTDPPVEYAFETDHPGLQQLYDTVTDQGVTAQVVPMWVPPEFELTELQVLEIYEGKKVHAKLECGNRLVCLSYIVYASEVPVKYEKEKTAVELYEAEGVGHFVVDNGDNLSATWAIKGVECLITTNLDKEQLFRMIDSVYKRNL